MALFKKPFLFELTVSDTLGTNNDFSFQSNGMVHFIGGGSVLTCTLGDCIEETGLANSFSTALDFALNSIKSK